MFSATGSLDIEDFLDYGTESDMVKRINVSAAIYSKQRTNTSLVASTKIDRVT
jgi:hypothetical protein